MPRFLALYMGSEDAPVQKTWDDLPEADRAARIAKAMTAWGSWVEQHRAAIVDMGGPLGRTLLADPTGISPTRNGLAAYVIVEAPTHQEAAEMFLDHPHFSIFPGTGIEILQCLPMPGSE